MIKYVPEIQLGHIIQAVAIIVTIGGGALGAYVSMASRIAIVESRMENDKEWRESVRSYMKETSAALQKMSNNFYDLRLELAKTTRPPPGKQN